MFQLFNDDEQFHLRLTKQKFNAMQIFHVQISNNETSVISYINYIPTNINFETIVTPKSTNSKQ